MRVIRNRPSVLSFFRTCNPQYNPYLQIAHLRPVFCLALFGGRGRELSAQRKEKLPCLYVPRSGFTRDLRLVGRFSSLGCTEQQLSVSETTRYKCSRSPQVHKVSTDGSWDMDGRRRGQTSARTHPSDHSSPGVSTNILGELVLQVGKRRCSRSIFTNTDPSSTSRPEIPVALSICRTR